MGEYVIVGEKDWPVVEAWMPKDWPTGTAIGEGSVTVGVSHSRAFMLKLWLKKQKIPFQEGLGCWNEKQPPEHDDDITDLEANRITK